MLLQASQRLGHFAFIMCLISLATANPVQAQTDYLGVPGPITFDDTAYHLTWSSQPTPNYVKQEYLPDGQAAETYDSMVLVEVLTGDIDPMRAAAALMKTLEQRKASDPLVNMELIENESTGEALLDFVLSAKDANGDYIVEWNAYRYAPYVDADGNEGVQMFGISHRAYGAEEAKTFLQSLASLRPQQIEALATTPLPGTGAPQ